MRLPPRSDVPPEYDAERQRERLQELAEDYPEECQTCGDSIEMTHPEDPPLCDECEDRYIGKMLELHQEVAAHAR